MRKANVSSDCSAVSCMSIAVGGELQMATQAAPFHIQIVQAAGKPAANASIATAISERVFE